MYVWGAAQRGIPPQVNVIGTAMFAIALLLVGASSLQGRRARRAALAATVAARPTAKSGS